MALSAQLLVQCVRLGGQADEVGRIDAGSVFQDVLVALPVKLGDGLAADLHIELHAASPRRCSARMSSRVRVWPALTSFKS